MVIGHGKTFLNCNAGYQCWYSWNMNMAAFSVEQEAQDYISAGWTNWFRAGVHENTKV